MKLSDFVLSDLNLSTLTPVAATNKITTEKEYQDSGIQLTNSNIIHGILMLKQSAKLAGINYI